MKRGCSNGNEHEHSNKVHDNILKNYEHLFLHRLAKSDKGEKFFLFQGNLTIRQRKNKVQKTYYKWFSVINIAETVGNQNDWGVDEKSDHNAGSYYFGIRIFFFI